MRDYRDAKTMAQTIRAALAAKGLKISISESLELIARAFGAGDWNTLAAAIKAAPPDAAGPPGPPVDALQEIAKAFGAADFPSLVAAIRAGAAATPAAPPAPAEPAPPGGGASPGAPEPRRTGQYFTPNLEASLHRSVALAQARQHQYTTLEHLLLALLDDADVAAVMQACRVDLAALRATVTRYIDEELGSLVRPDQQEPTSPTAGFHRVVQRAVIHVQSSGRGEVTGANLLVAIFSEQESHAAAFLQQQKMTRWDAVNFIAHGIRKPGAAA